MLSGTALNARLVATQTVIIQTVCLEEDTAHQIQVVALYYDNKLMCIIILDGNGPLSGRDTLYEDLRQICIHKTDPSAWWRYHNYFSKSCLNAERLKQCSEDTITSIGLSLKDINDCVKGSFKGNDLLDDNEILAKERQAFQQRGILTWPSVVINNMTYRVHIQQFFYLLC